MCTLVANQSLEYDSPLEILVFQNFKEKGKRDTKVVQGWEHTLRWLVTNVDNRSRSGNMLSST